MSPSGSRPGWLSFSHARSSSRKASSEGDSVRSTERGPYTVSTGGEGGEAHALAGALGLVHRGVGRAQQRFRIRRPIAERHTEGGAQMVGLAGVDGGDAL